MPDMSEENFAKFKIGHRDKQGEGVLVRVTSKRLLRNGLQIASRQATWPPSRAVWRSQMRSSCSTAHSTKRRGAYAQWNPL